MGEKILILSSNDEAIESLSPAAAALGDVSVGRSASAADNGDYSLVFIFPPLDDEYGLAAAARTAENTSAAVILAAAGKNLAAAWKKLENSGAMVLPKPLSRPLAEQTMRFMLSERKRRIAEKEKYDELNCKLRDIKIIDRAKFVLIQYLRITEDEAHSQLRKRAMDMRIPIARAAEDLLKTYEIL